MINWQLSKQGIRWPVSLERIAGSGVDPSRSIVFWSYPLTRYWFSNDRRLEFNFFLKNSYEIYCVYVPHNFKLTSDAKIQSAATSREDSCFWLFSPCSSLKFIRLLRVFSSRRNFFFVIKFLEWIFFRPLHGYFLGLICVQEFFLIKFSLPQSFFCTSPPHKFSNGPSLNEVERSLCGYFVYARL